mgnify:CR=1 FL=1
MKYYWNNGFYIDEIHFERDEETGEYTVPAGFQEITEERYRELLAGQESGKRIVTGDDGLPELAEQEPTPPDPVVAAETLLHTMQVRAMSLQIDLEDDATALTLSPICPEWKAGEHYEAGEIVNRNGQSYRVILAVDSLEHQPPDAEGMLTIYRPLNPGHAGTIDDPVPYTEGIDVYKDKYYSYAGKIYLAKADMIPSTYPPGSEGMWQWEAVE